MKCEVCGEEFAEADEDRLILHMQRLHPAVNDGSEMTDDAPTGTATEYERPESDQEPAQRRNR